VEGGERKRRRCGRKKGDGVKEGERRGNKKENKMSQRRRKRGKEDLRRKRNVLITNWKTLANYYKKFLSNRRFDCTTIKAMKSGVRPCLHLRF